MSGNFSFFDGDWIDAAKVAKQAEDILYIDQKAAITHLGTFCHMITELIFAKEGLGDTCRKTQKDKLDILHKKEILPNDINSKFHDIRMARNNAVYEGVAGLGQAVYMLQQAFDISVWAYRRYINSDYFSGEFKIPLKETEGVVDGKRGPSAIEVLKSEIAGLGKIKSQEPVDSGKLPLAIKKRQDPEIGHITEKNQELMEKTFEKSTTKPDQFIWILKCGHCGNIYGANGCDFWERKCPNCRPNPKLKPGKPGEPIEWWLTKNKHENTSTAEKKESAEEDKPTKMTLHEAMNVVLSRSPNKKMHVTEMADEIFRQGLYKKKDGNKAVYKQLLLRGKNYPKIFEVLPGKFIKLRD